METNIGHESVAGGVCKVGHGLPPTSQRDVRLCVDFYEKTIKAHLHPKYLLRILTTRIGKQLLLGAVQKTVPILLAISRAFGHIPFLGEVSLTTYSGGEL